MDKRTHTHEGYSSYEDGFGGDCCQQQLNPWLKHDNRGIRRYKKGSNRLLGQHLVLIIHPPSEKKTAGWIDYYSGCFIYIKARKYVVE